MMQISIWKGDTIVILISKNPMKSMKCEKKKTSKGQAMFHSEKWKQVETTQRELFDGGPDRKTSKPVLQLVFKDNGLSHIAEEM